MITNEAEVRIAVQAVLATVLAIYGFWGWAVLVLVIMLPWGPILAVGGYLAQPVVNWRSKKARDRNDKGIAQLEQELDNLLRTPKGTPGTPAPAKTSQSLLSTPPERYRPDPPATPTSPDVSGSAQDLTATLAIPPVIKDHVRSLPQGVFHNMALEVEEVKFHGDTAEAYVRFRSPSVTELIIRQRYLLRKSGERWQVESRLPANGGGKPPVQPLSEWGAPTRLSP
jgi:hypothetical protein